MAPKLSESTFSHLLVFCFANFGPLSWPQKVDLWVSGPLGWFCLAYGRNPGQCAPELADWQERGGTGVSVAENSGAIILEGPGFFRPTKLFDSGSVSGITWLCIHWCAFRWVFSTANKRFALPASASITQILFVGFEVLILFEVSCNFGSEPGGKRS